MRSSSSTRRRAAVLAAVLLLCRPHALFADDIVVMTSGAFTAAYLELVPAYERSTKHKLTTATTAMGTGAESIPNRLKRGEPADVVIVNAELLDDLIKAGSVLAGSRVDLARSSIAMAVRAGAPKPDISSADAVKRAMLAAKSIAYSTGPSGVYIAALFQRMGIADQIKDKVKIGAPGVPIGGIIARGEAEIGFQQVSELLPVAGIDYIGPLPPDIQQITVFASGIHTGATQADAAKALVKFLTSPQAAPVIKKKGMEPG